MDNSPIPFIDVAAQRRRLGRAIDDAIARVLGHCQFILGPEVHQVEADLAAFCGARHAITCASGTDALLMPLMAKGIGPGDAVFTPAFTFYATAEVAALVGLPGGPLCLLGWLRLAVFDDAEAEAGDDRSQDGAHAADHDDGEHHEGGHGDDPESGQLAGDSPIPGAQTVHGASIEMRTMYPVGSDGHGQREFCQRNGLGECRVEGAGQLSLQCEGAEGIGAE